MFTLRLKTPTFVTSRPTGRRLFHPSFPFFEPKTHLTDLQEPARKQTQVSAKLTSQIFSKQFPKTNCFFSPLSVHFMLNNIAKETAKGNTLKELLAFLEMKTKHENDNFYSHFNNVLTTESVGSFGIRYNTLFMTIGSRSAHPCFMNDHFARGGWFELFASSKMKKGEFCLVNGNKVKVPYLVARKQEYVYGKYDGFKVVGFQHYRNQEGGSCKMNVYVLLPDEKDGLEALVEKMGSGCDEFFERYIPDEKVELGEFAMPMFELFSDIDVAVSLKGLGLSLPFSFEHGTPEMFDPVELQNVCVIGIHQNYAFSLLMNKTLIAGVAGLSLGGGGNSKKKMKKEMKKKSKAKAAGVGCSVETKVVDFVVDRPFLLVMRDEVTKAMFFMGQVIDPSVKAQQMWYPDSTDA